MKNFLHRHRYIIRSHLVLAAICVCIWINTQKEWYDDALAYEKVAIYFGFLVITILAMNGLIESMIDFIKYRTKNVEEKIEALKAKQAELQAEDTHEPA